MTYEEAKLSRPQREVFFNNINEHNRALYRGIPTECELGYTCLRCHEHTDLDSSYSNKGYNMICHKCAADLAHSAGMTVGEYVVQYVHSENFKYLIM